MILTQAMVERLPHAIRAPWIREIDRAKSCAVVVMPEPILARQSDPSIPKIARAGRLDPRDAPSDTQAQL
jgi:hypothetical protein